MNILRNISQTLLKNVRPQIRVSVRNHNFDGDVFQRSEVNMLSKEDSDVIYIETISSRGFKLNSGFRIIGPCIIFPRTVLHWNINTAQEINENSLSLFPLLEPKLDILLIGIGDRGEQYDPDIIRFLRSKKLNVEILPTEQACATFNFINSERRYVAAALLPPKYDKGEDPFFFNEVKDELDKLYLYDRDSEGHRIAEDTDHESVSEPSHMQRKGTFLPIDKTQDKKKK
ncbi:NADH dehydrogenase [ubiquinone] 1 alpha subcomplex assembly factor 3 [Patella vulgata]|uniref:NADH dehydrogenase [ubiquinone] 1 alpha subcomplex assembly factor 3 n=1 Tax=Patella vulgata TaxID=6465 RepID=UPI00217FB879|nr:NADH dehydrogenase [ubiquinone] 1 alpha subcomplex assembly factor 3 [Patella vulgata]